MKYKFGLLEYPGLDNLGDYIQSIAVSSLIPEIHARIDREKLRNFTSYEKLIVVMNGWFSNNPENSFPPSASIIPIFWGFHITNWNHSWKHIITKESLDYLRFHAPIGCRDRYTAQKLNEFGIESFYSKCLTLLFKRREHLPDCKQTFVVDCVIDLPSELTTDAIFLTHVINPLFPEEEKFRLANEMLGFYNDNATLVITSRLHCALPCIAMGIPVIFFGDECDYRTSIISDIGVKINHVSSNIFRAGGVAKKELTRAIWSKVDWNPVIPRNIETEKLNILTSFNQFLSTRLKHI
jgi:hypothetical protein